MPELTRRRSSDAHEDCWHIYWGDIRAGTISVRYPDQSTVALQEAELTAPAAVPQHLLISESRLSQVCEEL
jgi:hypothetical protein